MNQNIADLRMTDELERRLMIQAIEQQFQPRPLRALAQLVGKSGSLLRAGFSPRPMNVRLSA